MKVIDLERSAPLYIQNFAKLFIIFSVMVLVISSTVTYLLKGNVGLYENFLLPITWICVGQSANLASFVVEQKTRKYTGGLNIENNSILKVISLAIMIVFSIISLVAMFVGNFA